MLELTADLSLPPQVPFDNINSGNSAWMLTSIALTLMLIIPGLALLYAGMVRKINILSICMQCFAIVCVVTLVWCIVGYSLAFTPGSQFIGSFDRFLLKGLWMNPHQTNVHPLALTIPESVYLLFQMNLAIFSAAILIGAIAERMKFSALLLFVALWSLFVYSPMAHMMWEPSGFFARMGLLDFAGGTVVHINAGVSGLVCAIQVGKRLDYDKYPFRPYNLSLTLIGAALLWVGWLGLNGGSAFAADGRAGAAVLMTQVAAATAGLAWMLVEWMARGVPTALGIATGALAGLVAITPASGFVGLLGALLIGFVAGVGCYFATTTLKRKLNHDDALNVFGMHGVGGAIGVLLTGLMNEVQMSGQEADFMVQIFAVAFTMIYSGGMSFIILKILGSAMALRVTEEQERAGLDISSHGESLT